MQPYKRTDRASSLIREALSRIMQSEARDKAVLKAVVTHVKVSDDFSIARVNVRCLDDSEQARENMLKALRRASGFLRARLATELDLFKTPELLFHYDDVPDKAVRIESLLAGIGGEKTMADVADDEGFDKDNLFGPDDD